MSLRGLPVLMGRDHLIAFGLDRVLDLHELIGIFILALGLIDVVVHFVHIV